MKAGVAVDKGKPIRYIDQKFLKLNLMNKHLQNWLDGLSQALVLYPEQDYLRPQRGDFRKDSAVLRGDAAKITKALGKNVAKDAKINPRLR